MKRVLTVLLALLLVLLAASCGKKTEDETFAPALDTETACKISVVGSYDNFEALEAEFDRFNEYYPNVELSYTKIDDYNNAIATVLSGNDAPNVFFSFSWMTGNQAYDGVFARMEDLADPALGDFDQILLRKTTNPALPANWISNASRGKGQYDDSLVLLNMKDLAAPLKEVARGPNNSYIGDINLHWNADRCLVTGLSDKGTWQVFECNLEDGSLRQVTPEMGGDVNNVEGCYVPDGSTIFVSSAWYRWQA